MTFEQLWHRVPGGTAVSIIELARALVHLDPPVEVVGVAARHDGPPPDPWAAPVPIRALPVPRLALYESWHLPIARWPRVERATGKVDVVHATAVAYPAAGAPVVVTVHDLAFLDDDRLATRHGHRFFRRGTELARCHAAIVVCPSQATFDDCRRAGFDERRLRVVPWGVDVQPVAAADVDGVRHRYGLERSYVLFCGTVEPRKNLPGLLEAFASLPRTDVDLVLVGPAGWNEELGALVDRHPETRARVRPLGFVRKDDRDALMAGADVFCYPSLREGFGLPVLEAMAQGTPVVTGAGTATEEVLGDAGVAVEPRDAAAIGLAIERLLDDPTEARRLGEQGRVRAGGYTWKRTAAGYLDAYEEARR